MRRAAGMLLLLLAATLAAGSPALARDDSELEDRYAGWLRRLDGAQTRIVEARRHYDAALAELRDQRQRRYPRGEEKQERTRAVQEARRELLEARAALPELVEEARRGGVPPGLLRRYEGPVADPGG